MSFLDKDKTAYVVGSQKDKTLERLRSRKEDYRFGVWISLLMLGVVVGLVLAFLPLALELEGVIHEAWLAKSISYVMVIAVAVATGWFLNKPQCNRRFWDQAVREGWLVLPEHDTFQLVMTSAVKSALPWDDELEWAVDKFFTEHQAAYMQDKRPEWLVDALFEVKDEKLIADETLEVIASKCAASNLFRRHLRDYYSVRMAKLIADERDLLVSLRSKAIASTKRIDELNKRHWACWYYENS